MGFCRILFISYTHSNNYLVVMICIFSVVIFFQGVSKPVDVEEVQEKVKDVICKTVTNIPLTESISRDQLSETVSVVIIVRFTM